MIDEPTTFELTGPLPTGTVVLEASAGTGKTYAMAALATRFVAEAGLPVSELLLVTFTRAATAELGERVRTRIVEAADHLDLVERTTDHVATQDPLLAHLGDAPADEVTRRRRRLATAVTDFDAAAISTIHGFCQQTLRGLGLLSAADQRLTILDDEDELLEQVVADLLVARYHERRGPPRPDAVRAAVRAAMRTPDATVLPAASAADDGLAVGDQEDPAWVGHELAELARQARAELTRRKRRAGVLSQDDLLVGLRDVLVDPDRGALAIAGLRARCRVALVDEFQDTDPVQWEILSRALRGDDGDGRALVLIGDPKQAIYGFRGADVRSYLRATEVADLRTGLTTNHRSDGALVAAIDGLFANTTYGEAGIVHRPVRAAEAHTGSALTARDPADATPFELRALTRDGDHGGEPGVGSVRHGLLPRDVATQIVGTLQDRELAIDGRPVVPGDLAVLVRANRDATLVQEALRAANVPAVLNGVGSVFASDAAREWLLLLRALERPSDQRRARALAVTAAFGGWDGHRLATADDDAWDLLHERLLAWSDVVRAHGVAPLLRRVAADTQLPARVLAHAGGERLSTDLEHVAQLLEQARTNEDLGLVALIDWLAEHRAVAGDSEVPPEEQARRLESDADAVQILTVHRSKGLEFGIVFCPYLWVAPQTPSPPITVHDPESDTRIIDVGPAKRPGYRDNRDLASAAQTGEDLRLLYVALTRARHRVVAWWVANKACHRSALAHVLFARDEHGVTREPASEAPDHTTVVERLGPLVASLGGRLTEVPRRVEVPRYAPSAPTTGTLRVAELERRIGRTWRRTSFSGLTARLGHGRTRSDDELAHSDRDGHATMTDDEELLPTPHLADQLEVGAADDAGRALRMLPLPMADVPGSPELGTMLHGVLERADLRDGDARAVLDRELAAASASSGLRGHHAALLEGLQAAVTTPLGPIAKGLALADVPNTDRMDEPRFELPLAGGDRDATRPAVLPARIADLLERHLAPEDPLFGYHERLRDPGFSGAVRGYLTGAIDLVLRIPTAGDGTDTTRTARYLVVDHKSNRLGWPETPTAYHYRPAALAQAMMDGHYPLQALLYVVALHRMLRWRQPGYDPAIHLGGVAYLFLRGMTGRDVPHVDGQPCGVFTWRPPVGLVHDLDALLAGRPGERSGLVTGDVGTA